MSPIQSADQRRADAAQAAADRAAEKAARDGRGSGEMNRIIRARPGPASGGPERQADLWQRVFKSKFTKQEEERVRKEEERVRKLTEALDRRDQTGSFS